MYADDTIILISNNCYEELNRHFNVVLYNTLTWFQANQLVLNMEKTKIVKFTPANFSNFSYFPLHITIGEILPVETNAVNFLGLELDSQLSWKPHIIDCVISCRRVRTCLLCAPDCAASSM
jgi:hypothetical protein